MNLVYSVRVILQVSNPYALVYNIHGRTLEIEVNYVSNTA